jgi:hypothetical protein
MVSFWLLSTPLCALVFSTGEYPHRILLATANMPPERVFLFTDEENETRTEHRRMRYFIRVKGHLDPFWQEWFENLSITHESNGTTLLSGLIRDQAALYGILLKMRDLGLMLLELSMSGPIEAPEE